MIQLHDMTSEICYFEIVSWISKQQNTHQMQNAKLVNIIHLSRAGNNISTSTFSPPHSPQAHIHTNTTTTQPPSFA